jgi:hypothetical protein
MHNHSNTNKLHHYLLILSFAAILISAPVFWLAFPQKIESFSIIENTKLDQFPKFNLANFKHGIKHFLRGDLKLAINTAFSDFLSNDFQEDLESAAIDQMPFRLSLASLARWVERAQISVLYGFLSDPAVPASLDVDYLLLRGNKQVYLQPPAVWDELRRDRVDDRVENYKNLIDLYPEVNFYIFYLERTAYAPYNPMNPYFPQADKGQSYEYFISNKPGELTVSSLRLSGLEEHQEKFFRTDHHWNIRGAWSAYEIIYKMLSKDLPDISPMLDLHDFSQIKGLEFCGSYARRTLYPCDPDIFEYAEVELPPHRTFENGIETDYGNKQAYLNGDFSRERYAEHYAEFYGYVTPLVEYDFDNPSGRNLLIIGGSYTQAMQEFVAAHYDRTYVVDLRDYENFYLGDFIKQHEIHDVLVIGDVIVYLNEGWQINP